MRIELWCCLILLIITSNRYRIEAATLFENCKDNQIQISEINKADHFVELHFVDPSGGDPMKKFPCNLTVTVKFGSPGVSMEREITYDQITRTLARNYVVVAQNCTKVQPTTMCDVELGGGFILDENAIVSLEWTEDRRSGVGHPIPIPSELNFIGSAENISGVDLCPNDWDPEAPPNFFPLAPHPYVYRHGTPGIDNNCDYLFEDLCLRVEECEENTISAPDKNILGYYFREKESFNNEPGGFYPHIFAPVHLYRNESEPVTWTFSESTDRANTMMEFSYNGNMDIQETFDPPTNTTWTTPFNNEHCTFYAETTIVLYLSPILSLVRTPAFYPLHRG